MYANSQIEQDVRDALQRDGRIDHPELIAVSVDEIGTVVLRGAVETPVQRLAAAHDARDIDGVFEVVVDDLKVHPPLPQLHTDDAIRVAAIERLKEDERIRSTHLHVKVSRGRLTLSGYVRHESERAAAEDAVAELDGVVNITNHIHVR